MGSVKKFSSISERNAALCGTVFTAHCQRLQEEGKCSE